MTTKMRRGLLVAAAAGCGLLAALTWSPDEAPAPRRRATADHAEQPTRREPRRDYPAHGESAPSDLARAEAAARARETPTVLTPPPALPREISARSGEPAPAQPMIGWISGYRDAVCACKTRSCVGDLQARFLNTLGGASYERERDEAAYVEASREAIRCYAALPEDS